MSVLGRRVVFVFVCLAGLFPALARAQQPGPGAPLPLALDLAKVPIGTQAEYAASMGSLPPMSIHVALVGRQASAATVEMTAEGGMAAMAGGKVVMSSVLESGKGDPEVKKMVMQVGANEPMEMPPELAHANKFKKPDPKTLVGPEKIKVKAGSFKTKHYRDKTPAGDAVDYWVSESAPPLGLVKMQAETKNAAAAAGAAAAGMAGTVTMELTSLGKDAKPVITKAPKPFDVGKLRQQVSPPGPGPSAPAPAPPAK